MTVVQELTALDSGVERAAERLLSLQHPDGWWKGELESNATMIDRKSTRLNSSHLARSRMPSSA